MRQPLGGGADGFLEEGGVEVVAHDLAGLRVFGEAACGEEVLPNEFAGGMRVFAGEGVGEGGRLRRTRRRGRFGGCAERSGCDAGGGG